MKVGVTGKAGLDNLARKLRKAAVANLPREMERGMRAAGEVVAEEIRGSTNTYMPKGYERVFAGSLVTRVAPRVAGAVRKVELVIRAFGARGHDRQVESLEAGRLKHKFWGRWVNVPQAWQRIRRGFASEPARRAAPKAVAELNKAATRVARSVDEL